MNTNYSVNQPAFSARLKLNDINLDRAKLAKAEETFSKLTQHYKNDELVIQAYKVDRPDNTYFHVADFLVDNKIAATSEPLKEFKPWFNNATAEDIGNAFARIFKKGKYEGKAMPKVENLQGRVAHQMQMAEVNKLRATKSGNEVFETLAEQNTAAAAKTQKILDKETAKCDATVAKIKDFESDIPIMEWNTWYA